MKKILILGANGMVGSSLVRKAEEIGNFDILKPSSSELNLKDQFATKNYISEQNPDIVILAAAKVGGIKANNTYPAEFIYDNVIISANVINSCYEAGVKRLIFLGSSCIYPKVCDQPIKEEYLLTSPLEPTNEAYAIAKISGLKMCQYYRRQYGVNYTSLMPTNLYGPNDNYDLENSHVLPALIRRFHEAKERCDEELMIWGDGTPLREFLHVDDLASACFHVLDVDDSPDWMNVGYGSDISILDLAKTVSEVVGFEGKVVTESDKALNGTPKKLIDSTIIKSLGWEPTISLKEGIKSVYKDYVSSLL